MRIVASVSAQPPITPTVRKLFKLKKCFCFLGGAAYAYPSGIIARSASLGQELTNLVVVAFDEPHQAEELRLKLQKLQSQYCWILRTWYSPLRTGLLSCAMPPT